MRIGILGLGQIGGSLLLSLQEKAELSGFDVSPKLLEEARGILDFLPRTEEELFSWAELTFLAIPVREIIKALPRLKPYSDKLFIDTGSTKEEIMEKASDLGIRFAGGHPLAGTEKRGKESWQEDLFHGRPFYLFQGSYLGEDDRERAEKVVKLLGAEPIWWEPSEHDRVMALVSHLPYITSLALLASCRDLKDHWGPGFLSATRLALQEPKMCSDILLTQRRLSEALDSFQKELSKLIDLLDKGKQQELISLANELSRLRDVKAGKT